MSYPEEQTFGPLIPSASTAWLLLLEDVMKNGLSVKVRGRNITEILHRTQVIDMKQPIVSITSRKLGYAFLCAEAAWILSGRNDVQSIAPYSKAISSFSDDGKFFRGAYGPQIIQQLPYIIESLNNDLYTRQAVISIWKPSPMPSKDIPCTVAVQFMVRGGLLHTFVDMRSSDCWLGVPYDWFNFSMLTKYLLLMLKEINPEVFSTCDLGFLHFKANSQHIYEDDIPKVIDVMESKYDQDKQGEMLANLVIRSSNSDKFISNLWAIAGALLEGEKPLLEF